MLAIMTAAGTPLPDTSPRVKRSCRWEGEHVVVVPAYGFCGAAEADAFQAVDAALVAGEEVLLHVHGEA